MEKNKNNNVEDLKDTKNKKFDASKKLGVTDIKGIIKQFKFNTNTKRCILINIYRRNGTFDQFFIYPTNETFTKDKRTYIIDEECLIYNNTTRVWSLTYHEDSALPIKLNIDVKGIKEFTKNIAPQISSSVNPETLNIYMKSSFVQKIMRGEELDKVFKMLKLIGGISALCGIITVLILLKTTGVLNGIF